MKSKYNGILKKLHVRYHSFLAALLFFAKKMKKVKKAYILFQTFHMNVQLPELGNAFSNFLVFLGYFTTSATNVISSFSDVID